jgi:hypothetical protein
MHDLHSFRGAFPEHGYLPPGQADFPQRISLNPLMADQELLDDFLEALEQDTSLGPSVRRARRHSADAPEVGLLLHQLRQ